MTDLARLVADAEAQHRAGRLAPAIAGYRAALAAVPAHDGIRLMLAMALAQSGQLEPALATIDAARAPDEFRLLALRGVCLMEMGRLDEALAVYDRALGAAPRDFGLAYNRATALKRLGRNVEALAGFDAAIALNGSIADAHNNRGVTLTELGRRDEAITSYDRALALAPGHVDALLNRGKCLAETGDFDAALASYEGAVRAAPMHRQALEALAGLLVMIRRPREAAACFDRLAGLGPETLATAMLRLHCRMFLAEWDGFDAAITAIAGRMRAGEAGANPFILTALIDDPPLIRASAAALVAALPAAAAGPAPEPDPSARLRIGYFSADFRDHPVMTLFGDMLGAHDRSRFEVSALSFGPPTDDDWRRRVAAEVDHFIDVRGRSDAEVAATARSLGLDIAIDLMGFTSESRPGIFVARPAPVQVNFLGYPGSFGAPEMDYIIVDAGLVPPAERAGYSEKLLVLPETYQPNAAWAGPVKPAERSLSGLPETGVVFAAMHQQFKILPETFDRWLAIVAAVEGSVLWLRVDDDDVRARLAVVAAARGVARERLVFAGHVGSRAEYLARLAAADLFLDTLPYNAHATASDALRAGLPVLTLPGRGYAARVGASLLTTLGLPELIATNGADFVARGIRLGRDAAARAALRSKLAAALPVSPLFDPARFVRHLESGLATLLARHRDGDPPGDIKVVPIAR